MSKALKIRCGFQLVAQHLSSIESNSLKMLVINYCFWPKHDSEH